MLLPLLLRTTAANFSKTLRGCSIYESAYPNDGYTPILEQYAKDSIKPTPRSASTYRRCDPTGIEAAVDSCCFHVDPPSRGLSCLSAFLSFFFLTTPSTLRITKPRICASVRLFLSLHFSDQIVHTWLLHERSRARLRSGLLLPSRNGSGNGSRSWSWEHGPG